MTKQVASLHKPLHLDAFLSCALKSAASRTPEAYERLVVEGIMTETLIEQTVNKET
ncbi:MAG: hypothetical protein IT451_06290 [Candidatus Brocadia sp.]|nr:hypothetical protein [Candidatus Brocadia sp.]